MVVCAVSELVQLRYNLCMCLLDEGSEDIQVLPNGLALITSVSDVAFYVISEMILLLMSTSTTTITAFSGNTIVDIVDNDDEDQSMNQSISIFIPNKQQYKLQNTSLFATSKK